MQMKKRTWTLVIVCVLLIRQTPAQLNDEDDTYSLANLQSLETSISTSWRNGARATFQTGTSEALSVAIPRAILQIISKAGTIFSKLPKLSYLAPIFSILSIIADVINMAMFSGDTSNNQFAELYPYLQDNFDKVNAMIEANYHAIKDMQNKVLCGQTYSEISLYKTQIQAFFDRYLEMMKRARDNGSAELSIFDIELRAYRSSTILISFRWLLHDPSLYIKTVEYCAQGDMMAYLQIVVELQHTFKQAIILERLAKTRLYNISKVSLELERINWREKVSQVVNLMAQTGNDLLRDSWYPFYVQDADTSLRDTAVSTALKAAKSLSSTLTTKYPQVHTAVIIIPYTASWISITDAFGAEITMQSKDNFICYKGQRANGDTVIAFCRNALVYDNEQDELNRAFDNFTQGNLSANIVEALVHNLWDDLATVMKANNESFFSIRVQARLRGGSVTMVKSTSAPSMVFYESSGNAFQALVISKLVPISPDKLKPPSIVNTATAVRTRQWSMVFIMVAVIPLLSKLMDQLVF